MGSTPPFPRRSGEVSPSTHRLTWAALMCSVAVASIWSRLRVVGTPEADAVEYLERAQGLVRLSRLEDAQAIRSIGVSLLHAPYLLVADVLGLGQGPWVLAMATVVHLGISALFVAATVHLARRWVLATGLSEERAHVAGWAAGFICLASPSFLQYAAIPMADIAAGAGVALGLIPALAEPPTRRSATRSGLILGLAVLASFKAIPLLGLGLLAGAIHAALHQGFSVGARWLGRALVPVMALALLQAITDWVTYGSFGASIYGYLEANLGQRLVHLLYKLGFVDAARELYIFIGEYAESDLSTRPEDVAAIDRESVLLAGWRWFLPLPAILLAGVGLLTGVIASLAALGRGGPRKALVALWPVLAPIAIAAAYADATVVKGSAAMRIWLPILPMVAAISGLGVAILAGRNRPILERPRTAAALLVVAASMAMGIGTLLEWKPAGNAHFARSAAWLRELGPTPDGRTPRFTCSYHWSVIFRAPRDWELVKLPDQLDGLQFIDQEEQQETWDELRTLDALALHWSLLRAETEASLKLIELVEEEFELAAAFWDEASSANFGPVLLFARPDLVAGIDRTLYRATPGVAEGPPDGASFERWVGPDHEIVQLLDARVERLPGDGLHWVELDVEKHTPLIGGYHLMLDVVAQGARNGWTLRRRPCWGKIDLSEIAPGCRWTEGAILSPAVGPTPEEWAFGEPSGPHDGPFTLWFDLATLGRNEAGEWTRTGRLELIDPSDGKTAERLDLLNLSEVSDDGFVFLRATGGVLLGEVDPAIRAGGGSAISEEGPLRPR